MSIESKKGEYEVTNTDKDWLQGSHDYIVPIPFKMFQIILCLLTPLLLQV